MKLNIITFVSFCRLHTKILSNVSSPTQTFLFFFFCCCCSPGFFQNEINHQQQNDASLLLKYISGRLEGFIIIERLLCFNTWHETLQERLGTNRNVFMCDVYICRRSNSSQFVVSLNLNSLIKEQFLLVWRRVTLFSLQLNEGILQ